MYTRKAIHTPAPMAMRTAAGSPLGVTKASTKPEISSTGTSPIATVIRDRAARARAHSLGREPGRTHAQKVRSPAPAPTNRQRSEEHTPELQSRGHLVCSRLLEKQNVKSYVRIYIATRIYST